MSERFVDWRQDSRSLVWRHPETGIEILDEDMPWELRPVGRSDG